MDILFFVLVPGLQCDLSLWRPRKMIAAKQLILSAYKLDYRY